MINKENLLVVPFASEEESRYALTSVYFTPTETIATNGHYLVRVTNPPSETVQTTNRSFLIPAVQLKSIKVKNGDAIELTTNGNDTSWNLTTGASTYHLTEQTDTTFPNIEAVMPTEEPKTSFCVNAAYLEKLCRSFAAFTKNDPCQRIKISVWEPLNAIRITADNDKGQTMTALLMPLR